MVLLKRFFDGAKTIYIALFIWTIEQPLSKISALPKSFLATTEILHFEW